MKKTRFGHPLLLQIPTELVPLLVEEVGKAFQEEHTEDVFLVFRGVHVSAQVVTGTKQEAGKLAEGEFLRHLRTLFKCLEE
jgi:hypothetical protein